MKSYHKLADLSRESRLVNHRVAEALKEYKLTPMEWCLVGLISEGESTASKLAKQLGTSMAFTTVSINKLEERGVVKRGKSPDTRAKPLTTNEELVQEIESKVWSVL